MRKEKLAYTYGLNDIELVLRNFWSAIESSRIIAFSGEMGAGKTTFISKLCDWLHVDDVVSSPTFSLINEYHFPQGEKETIIYHMDWYRIKTEEELLTSGIEDCMLQALKDNNYCFIEWPEKASDFLPIPYVWVRIDTLDEDTRHMTVTEIGH